MKKNNKKLSVQKAFVKMCLRVGQKDVNCICRGYFYQPVVSEKLKKRLTKQSEKNQLLKARKSCGNEVRGSFKFLREEM